MLRITRLALVLALAQRGAATAADWPQFRGPNGNGTTDHIAHPTEWSADKNVVWKVSIPGAGWSSPIISGEKVFLTTAVADKPLKPKSMSEGSMDLRSMGLGARIEDAVFKFEVVCLDLESGSTQWSTVVAEQKPLIPVHPSNTHATESPVTDGENVYAYFGTIGLVACVGADGQKKWTKEIGTYPVAASLGSGSSLTYGEGLVFLACDNEKQSFLLAMDPKTGEQVWRRDSQGKTSWATPILWKNNVRTELVACSGKEVNSYDPNTGDVLWTMSGLDSGFSASPACDDKRIYFGGASPGSAAVLYAVKAGATGDIRLKDKSATSNEWVVWSSKRNAPGMASPVVVGNELYVVNNFLNCHDATTGERIYRQRLADAKEFAASPWAAGDKIFLTDEQGRTFVVQAGREFKLLATNTLDDLFWSTAAVAENSILLRGVDFLYCIRE